MKIKALILLALFAANAHAGVAYLSGQYVSGLNRICIYSAPAGQINITVPASSLCPLSINY
mgnify:CR=1 FL=1